MKINLRINKKDKQFSVDQISAFMLRRVIEMNKTMNLADMDADTLDAVADFIVDVFEGQFTREEVYKGLSSHELIPTYDFLSLAVMKKVNEAIGAHEDPNVRAGE